MTPPPAANRVPPPPARPGDGLLIRGDNRAVIGLLLSAWGPRFDFLYCDPPFCSGRDYRTGPSRAPARAGFTDRWDGGLDGFLAWLRPRLALQRDLLTDRGSMVVHLDAHAVHYVKIELDRIFGRDHFLNEIVWHYTGGGRSRRYFSRKHDNLLWYRKGKAWTFQVDAVRVPYRPTSGYARAGIVSAAGKRYLPHPDGTPVDDVWSIPMVNPLATERTGYPTQKPEALLDRLLAGCTDRDDLVGDFFAGSGTTGRCAARAGRRWVLADDSAAAIAATRERLAAALGVRGRTPPGATRPFDWYRFAPHRARRPHRPEARRRPVNR